MSIYAHTYIALNIAKTSPPYCYVADCQAILSQYHCNVAVLYCFV